MPVTWSGSSMTITRNELDLNVSAIKYYVTALIQVDA